MFKIFFERIIKNHEKLTDSPPIKINVNKIENRITFKIKTVYYLKLLTPKTMKLLGSTEKGVTKEKKSRKYALFRNY